MSKTTSQYAIYKILISASTEGNLFLQHVDGTSMLEHAQEHFASLFGGKNLTIVKNKEDGEPVIYPNDILRNEEGVIVLRLNNVQYKKLIKRKETQSGVPNYEEVKEESNPYCYVIIDNQDGVLQMAIQKSPSWGSDTDTVRDLLQETFNQMMKMNYKLEVKIMNKMQPTKFWQFVKQQYLDNNDYIEQFIIDLINPRKATVDNSGELKGVMKKLSDFLVNLDALDATLSVNTNSTSYFGNNKKAYRDFVNIVDMCSCNGYHLGCKFHNMGYYSCDSRVMAMFNLDEDVLNGFLFGIKDLSETIETGEYALVRWLAHVRETTKSYEYAESIPKKPKRNRKK